MTLLKSRWIAEKTAAGCGTDSLVPLLGRWRELAVAGEPKIGVKFGRSETWASI